jgi:hypothetical protein
MHRRKPSEKVKSFRIDRTDDLALLARKAARWAADIEEFLRKPIPTSPCPTVSRTTGVLCSP